MSVTRVVFVLVDGLGVGIPDPGRNPAARPDLPILSQVAGGHGDGTLPYGGRLAPADAGLGVPGIPQSATGQTTLLTGLNGAKLAGRHRLGLPDRGLREALAEHSILRAATEAGRKAAFLNAFGPAFFRFPRQGRRRWIASTTTATIAAGLPLMTVADLAAGQAVSHDFTNEHLRREGCDLPLHEPEEAGVLLAHAAEPFEFSLYEHFLTDRAGHAGDPALASAVLGNLEGFLRGLLHALDLTSTLLVLASDHGNVEDLSTRGHTANPAAVALWGPGAAALAATVKDLQDVPRCVRETLGLPKLPAAA
ncbi:MAG: hypothetical protein L0216_06990 [Planctomycetales bacterium]|nr:hypothetical protein [Planctomycetales bacterium]